MSPTHDMNRFCTTLRLKAFRKNHERLMDAIQAGRSTDAYEYARLLSYLARQI